jgi:hypothetical protein
VCVYRDGFLFHLISSTSGNTSRLGFRGRYEEERRNQTRLVVRYADGRMADSTQMFGRRATHGLLLLIGSDFASRGGDWHSEQTMWLVMPLPVTGPVSFDLYLPGETAASGSASFDSAPIVSAAVRAEALWPPREMT